jgi:hypothetical protein
MKRTIKYRGYVLRVRQQPHDRTFEWITWISRSRFLPASDCAVGRTPQLSLDRATARIDTLLDAAVREEER